MIKKFPAVDRCLNFPHSLVYGSESHFLINRKTNTRLLRMHKHIARTHNHRETHKCCSVYVCGKHKLLIEFSAQNYTLFVSAHMLKRKYCSVDTHTENETTYDRIHMYCSFPIIITVPAKKVFPYIHITNVSRNTRCIEGYTLRTQSVYRFSSVLE